VRAALEASMRRSRAGASTRRDADAVAAEVVKRRQDEEAQPAADAAGCLGCMFCQCQGRDTVGLRPTQQVVGQHQSELHDVSASGRDTVGEPSISVAACGRPKWQGTRHAMQSRLQAACVAWVGTSGGGCARTHGGSCPSL
jgi:hypothetical protein